MKANKAPEKIYVDNLNHDFFYRTKDANSIEYIRKDAFLEKACQFIKEHHYDFSFWDTVEYELGFNTQKFIEDFKKYMEE